MGYRSTVAYTIRFTPFPSPQEAENGDTPNMADIKECKESFYCFLAEAKLKCAGAMTDTDYLVIDEDDMAINHFASDVKWYESYDDVQCHEALMQLSKDWVEMGNHNIGGIFVRVGEEMDDVVEEGWGVHYWEWIGVRREIVCDWMD
jgi:hypothetical protein